MLSPEMLRLASQFENQAVTTDRVTKPKALTSNAPVYFRYHLGERSLEVILGYYWQRNITPLHNQIDKILSSPLS